MEPGEYQDSILSEEGCVSNFFEISITELPNPTIEYETVDFVCIDNIINFISSASGSWSVSDSSIAVINDAGILTGIAQGVTEVTFTEFSTGCKSDPLSVNVVSEDNELCIVSTKKLSEAIVNIYPNPASKELTVESNRNIQSIRLISLKGKSVFENKMIRTKSLILDLSHIVDGVYILETWNDGKRSYDKIVIQK